MRTFWAWRVVGDSRAGFSRLTSAANPRAKDLRGRSKVNNYFINFAHSFFVQIHNGHRHELLFVNYLT